MSSARAVLPPVPTSARAAREVVKQACTTGSAGSFEETAVLLTSELVTNAVVHAHSELELLVETNDDGLRVEVRDRDPRLPERRGYDAEASTGRGGLLIETLADDFGAEQLGPAGKAVWFCLGRPPARAHEPRARQPRTVVAEPVPVLLAGLPVQPYRSWQEHADGLLREAFLAGCDPHAGTAAVVGVEEHTRAGRALSLLAAAVGSTVAAPTRHDRADVPLAVPEDDVLAFAVLRGALAKSAAAAAAGLLLCPPALPELGMLRDWLCDEVARQASGLAPQPWRHPTPIDPRGSGVRAACLAVRGSSAAEVLADEHDVIVAVSAAASRLLGWPDGHLEGAPVTTLVPERHVAAHTAAFHKVLVSGRGRRLDRPVVMPARCRDGSEVRVTVTVSQHREPDGRLFHALLEARQTPMALNPPST